MSTFTTGFNINNVDMAEYFPAYELFVLLISVTSTTPFTATRALVRNKTSTTNYIVFTSMRFSTGSTATIESVSDNSTKPMVYEKTATDFKVYVRYSGTGEFLARLWCLVIYLPNTVRAITSSIAGYNNNGTQISTELFPQTLSNISSVSSGTTNPQNHIINVDLTAKGSSSINYINLDSWEHTGSSPTVDIACQRVYPIMFYNINKTSINYTMTFRTSGTVNLNLNSIAIYQNTIPNNNTTTSYNVVIDGVEYDLTKIFPTCEHFSVDIPSNTNSSQENTFTLTKNTRGTLDYAVFPSYYYRFAGSASTWDPYEASQFAQTLLVRNFTATSFSTYFRKATGDFWAGGVSCLVVYY